MERIKPTRRTVSILGWFFLIISGFYVLGSIFCLFTVEIEQNTQRILKVISQKYSVSEGQWAEVLSIQKKIFFANLVLCVPWFISSIGFLKRKEWGRKGFVYLSGLTFVTASIALFPISRFLFILTSIFDPSNARPGIPSSLLLVFIFAIALLVWFVKFLRSQNVKSQFE